MLKMPIRVRIIIPVILILAATTDCTSISAASFPSGSGSGANSFGNPAPSATKQMNPTKNQDNGAPAAESKEQKEANPILYENYQQCYASLISEVIGRPDEEIDARKSIIKKYCKAISRAKYQKKFSDCFNARVTSGSTMDAIIEECVSSNDYPVK